MVTSDSLARSYQKQYQYVTTDSTNIITLIDNRLNLINDKIPTLDSTTWVNGFIKVLTCKSSINSLESVPMPEYLDTDTDSERLTKTKSVVWDSPAYRLVLYLQDPGSTTWVEKVFYNLTNSFGFPYILTQLLDGLTTDIARDIAEGAKLGVSFEDIGWGLPKYNDVITIDCVWSAEYNWIKNADITISQPLVVQTATVQQVVQRTDTYNLRVGTSSVVALPANTSRISSTFKNSSNINMYYGLDTTPTTTTGILVSPNTTVSLPSGFKGVVNVIAASGLANTAQAVEVYNVPT